MKNQNMWQLTDEEKSLLDRLTLNAVANGNTVNPKPFEPSGDEYKLLFKLRIKLGLNE